MRRFAQQVIRWRWLILLVSILTVGVAGSGGRFLKFKSDYHMYFDDDNLQVLAFDELQNKYTKGDNVLIVVAPKQGDALSKASLEAMEDLERMSWQVPYSSRVDAISNFQHTRAMGDDLYVEDLASDIHTKTDSALQYIREVALREPLLMDRLISEDGRVAAINVTINLPAENSAAPVEVKSYILGMLSEWESKYPGHDTYLSGIVMLNASFAEMARKDLSQLVPMMFLVILLAVLMITRSISAMVVSLMVIFFSILSAMGLAGWMGIELSAPSASAPTMIMTLAIADSIHLLVTMLQLMRNGVPKYEAIAESIKVNFTPVLITSATTIIGFLTLNFAEGAPFHDLGNITAVGVGAAFFYSVLLLPSMVAILPFRVKRRAPVNEKSNMLSVFANFVIGRHRPILVLSVITVLGISYLSLENELNNRFVEFFDVSVPFRSDTDFISDNLTGVYNLEYSLGTGEADGITSPEYLRKLEEFERWFGSQPEVIHVNAFSEIMRKVNASMHGDDPAYYRMPETKEQAAQFLLLYEMSLPYGLDLNNQINVDKSETRLIVTMDNVSSNDLLAQTEKAENWLRDNAPPAMFSHGVSTALMFAHITRTNMHSMLRGGLGALILISLLLIIIFRSLKYGLISLLPNVAPIAIAYGVWYLIDGEINMAGTVVLGMTLGIVVDDTVHLLAKYRRARKEMGKTPEEAIRYTFNTVGKAVITTTVVLMAGFLVLMQSSFGINAEMAKLTTITIGMALVLDMVLLPAILLTFDKTNS